MAAFEKIKNIITQVSTVINNAVTKKPEYATILLAYAAPMRSGISPSRLTAKIIADLAAEGYPTGTLPSGEKSWIDNFIQVMVSDICYEMTHNARIETGAQIGSIVMTGEGANAGGPVVVTGQNITTNKTTGIIV